MAKYNWRKNRLTDGGIEIFHYARRLGKTTELARRVARDPNAILVVPHRELARYTRDNHPHISTQIFTAEEIPGWSRNSARVSRYLRNDFSSYNYYIDEADGVDSNFLGITHYIGKLKAISFTNCRGVEQENIIKDIVDKNQKTYYHKYHDENSQIYRRITRFEPTARAELMPGNMLRR